MTCPQAAIHDIVESISRPAFTNSLTLITSHRMRKGHSKTVPTKLGKLPWYEEALRVPEFAGSQILGQFGD